MSAHYTKEVFPHKQGGYYDASCAYNRFVAPSPRYDVLQDVPKFFLGAVWSVQCCLVRRTPLYFQSFPPPCAHVRPEAGILGRAALQSMRNSRLPIVWASKNVCRCYRGQHSTNKMQFCPVCPSGRPAALVSRVYTEPAGGFSPGTARQSISLQPLPGKISWTCQRHEWRVAACEAESWETTSPRTATTVMAASLGAPTSGLGSPEHNLGIDPAQNPGIGWETPPTCIFLRLDARTLFT